MNWYVVLPPHVEIKPTVGVIPTNRHVNNAIVEIRQMLTKHQLRIQNTYSHSRSYHALPC